jgi:hypothetical protein
VFEISCPRLEKSNHGVCFVILFIFSLAQAQSLFGSEREAVEYAYPGDVIGKYIYIYGTIIRNP